MRAIRMGFASPHDVRKALDTQRYIEMKAEKVGDILQEIGLVTAEQYTLVMKEIREQLQDTSSSGEANQLFCDAAIKHGFVTDRDIQVAAHIRERWQRRGKLIGRVMVELGHLSDEQLQEILNTYKAHEDTR